MPVNETIELRERIAAETNVDVAAVVVNRVLPELFGRGEEEVFDQLREPEKAEALSLAAGGPVTAVLDAAELAVRLRRTRAGHLARLREGLGPSANCSTCLSCSPAITAYGPRNSSPKLSVKSSVSDVGQTQERRGPDRSSSSTRRRRSSSTAAPAASARRQRRRRRRPRPPSTSAARCSCSPSIPPSYLAQHARARQFDIVACTA